MFWDVTKINFMNDNIKKQLTDDEIEEIIKKKYSKKLPHTKDYIRDQLREDSNYKCKFSMVKQDFIDKLYFYATTLEFKERLRRNKSVFNYCISNNIIYIEIPYTKLQNYNKVLNIIKRVFLNQEDVNTVIGKLPKIKYRKEDQNG